MLKTIQSVDKEHHRVWYDNRCPNCDAFNITPIGKRARRNGDWCWYICEECHTEFGPLKYAQSI